MYIKLKYGNSEYRLCIPEKADVSILRPAPAAPMDSLNDAVNHALDDPLGCDRFEDLARRLAPRRVAIAVPDETRSTPVKDVLPILLNRLYSALPGLEPSAVCIVVGGGLHPPMDGESMQTIVPPEVAPGCRVVSHDARGSRMVDLGVTSRGTPVRINAEFAEADFKIIIGQIDVHQFIGFTGGAKGAVIGCGSVEGIQRNHSLVLDDNARTGVIDGNPAREDINEAGDMIGIDMIVDVVLNADHNAVELFAGEPTAVLRKGAETCATIYGIAIEDEFDIVVASCGGHPKDICLYQAQKGLTLASRAVRPGGKILLLVAAPQGAGDDRYLAYVSRFSTPQEVLEDFTKLGFTMGAHKAFLFARTLIDYDVAVHSDVDADILEKCLLRKVEPDSIMKKWVEEFDGTPRIAVVPNANTTYFYSA